MYHVMAQIPCSCPDGGLRHCPAGRLTVGRPGVVDFILVIPGGCRQGKVLAATPATSWPSVSRKAEGGREACFVTAQMSNTSVGIAAMLSASIGLPNQNPALHRTGSCLINPRLSSYQLGIKLQLQC